MVNATIMIVIDILCSKTGYSIECYYDSNK